MASTSGSRYLGLLVEEMAKRKIRVFADLSVPLDTPIPGRGTMGLTKQDVDDALRYQVLNDAATPVWVEEWESAADTLIDSIKENYDFFFIGVLGKVSGHDWLRCDTCGELQMRAKSEGAPSAVKPCKLTFKCSGKARRMSEIFEVLIKPPSTRKKKGFSSTNQSTGRQGRKGYSEEVVAEGLRLFDESHSAKQIVLLLKEKFPEDAAKVTTGAVYYWSSKRKLLPTE